MKARVNLKDFSFSSRLKKKGKKSSKERSVRGGFVLCGGWGAAERGELMCRDCLGGGFAEEARWGRDHEVAEHLF